MNILDDIEEFKKLDPSRTLDSIQAFPKQLEHAWKQSQKIIPPAEFKKAKNVIVTGMGGSALGGRITKSLFEDEIKIPFFINTEYQLPGFINSETLVIVASYSGNTEETLSSFNHAKKAKTMIFGITTGGKLGEEIRHGLPGLIFQPKYNFLGYPKTAIGYSLGTLLGVLSKMELINLTSKQFFQDLNEFKKIQKNFLAETPFRQNSAKKLAKYLQGKIGVFVASEHLKGAAWTAKNQINENAHSHALLFDLPEMNHHLVEAFNNPIKVKPLLAYLFLSSPDYFSRLNAHYQVSQQILKKIKSPNQQYQTECRNKLAQAFEIIQLGGFISFYLSVLNNQDPGPEPWIIYLKKHLAAYGKKI